MVLERPAPLIRCVEHLLAVPEALRASKISINDQLRLRPERVADENTHRSPSTLAQRP